MPYNTRRKSLSLESLGIHVPNSSRAAHRSPPTMTPVGEETTSQAPPTKKVKRSHTLNSLSNHSSPASTPKRKTSIKFEERPKSRPSQHTPPPSPGGEADQHKIDIEGIDDDIVVGVIQQLEKTGNRPHLLKELAAILSGSLQSVQRYARDQTSRDHLEYLSLTSHSSANPAAIISSRLATYLRRTWTALSPCPVAKTLVGTHPKRVYYFLTTIPAQDIPPPSSVTIPARIISPSLSSASVSEDQENEDEDEKDSRSRARMSPSPDLDLTALDFENGVSTPFSENTPHPPTSTNMAHNRRAVSPPLECDEREFSHMVSTLQRRRSDSQKELLNKSTTTEPVVEDMMDVTVEETEESAARKNSEAAAALFGAVAEHLDTSAPVAMVLSSPVLKAHPLPRLSSLKRPLDEEAHWAWDELPSPEHVELEELDDMFGEY